LSRRLGCGRCIWWRSRWRLFADYLLEDKRYERFNTSLFNETLLEPYDNTRNWCGCGSCMIAVDYKGELYPCLRFKTVDKQKPWVIGNIYDGIDNNKLRPFYFCHHMRKGECVNCEFISGCATCPGLNYDETGNIFERITYSCAMHKARYEVNKYFFNKIKELEGKQ
jgi:radical SAM protein with 4Fe4S-binding SPASM domain